MWHQEGRIDFVCVDKITDIFWDTTEIIREKTTMLYISVSQIYLKSILNISSLKPGCLVIKPVFIG